ncbi:MAG: hypothetical protein RIS79_1344 [Verrucomicrobiota bacterium]
MKTVCASTGRGNSGFTIIEISLVIGLLLGLVMFAGISINAVRDWQRGKDASISLQAVFAAQRAYLSDHPTANIAVVSAEQLNPYFPQGWNTMPVVKSLDDQSLTVDYATMPPILLLGSSVYDPSSSGTDGLWDVGQ